MQVGVSLCKESNTFQSLRNVIKDAMFAISHDDAANNCKKSPAELIPYANTLAIQQRLAKV